MNQIVLRTLQNEDIQSLYEIFMNKESTRYWLTKCNSKEEVERMIRIEYMSYYRRGLSAPYVVVLDDKVIGLCNFNDEFDGVGRIGFILNQKYEHCGYMTNALTQLIEIGFTQCDYHRIEALVFPQNRKSKRTLERVGFIKEACMSNYLKHEGFLYDIDLYAIVRRGKDEKRIINEV